MEVNQYNALENNRHLWYGRDEIFLLDLTNTIPIPTKYIKHKEILERCKNRLESSYDLGHISFKRYCYECKKNIDFVCSLSSRDCHITKPCKKHPFSILELYGINQKCKCEGCKENYFFNKSLSISVKRKFAKELLPKKRLGRKPRTKLEREILDELSGKNAVRQMNLAKEICKIGHSLRGKKTN